MAAPTDLSKLRIDRDAPSAPAGLVFAVVMGVVGVFFPARRASKLPVIQALR